MIILKKTTKFLISFLLIFLISIFIYFVYNYINTTNSNISNSEYEANHTNYEIGIENTVQSSDNTPNIDTNIEVPIHETTEYIPVEEELSTFTTTIYNKESARQNNISLVVNAVNGSIVKNGDTFSFTSIVGPATPEKGYQKANVIDKDGNNVPGYGGGMCQVSTTLYNAILTIPDLTVTERHPHSAIVPYIESGKDAAVAYGSIDLKFTNNTGYDIKISLETTGDEVIAKIISLK